jgi:hypothetical protein
MGKEVRLPRCKGQKRENVVENTEQKVVTIAKKIEAISDSVKWELERTAISQF